MSVPDSVLFGHGTLGVGPGIWGRTKGLLNHHIATATERERERERGRERDFNFTFSL